jgi:hypothetical protein
MYAGRMYRSTYSLPQRYLEVSGQLCAPAVLPRGKELPLHIGYEAGSAPEPVWGTRRENP